MPTDFTRTWRTAAQRTTAARNTSKAAAVRTSARKRGAGPAQPGGRQDNGQAPPARNEPAGTAPGGGHGSGKAGAGGSAPGAGAGAHAPGGAGRSAGTGPDGRGGRVVRAATAAPAAEAKVSGGGGGRVSGGGGGGSGSTTEAIVRTPVTAGRDGGDWPSSSAGAAAPGAGRAPMAQRMSRADALARGRDMGRRPARSRTVGGSRRRRRAGVTATKFARRRGLLRFTPFRLFFMAWAVVKLPFHLTGLLLALCLVFILPAFFSLGGTSEHKTIDAAASPLLRVNWDPKVCATLPVPENRVCTYGALFNAAGEQFDVDPRLLAAVAYVESGYRTEIINCTVTSNAVDPETGGGARGIMQFMPSTAAGRGVDPCDPVSAIPGAAKYLRELYDELGGWNLAIAGYNAGGGAVRAAGNQVPDFAETQAYVPKVQAKWTEYQRLFPATSGGGCTGTSRRGTTDLQETPHVTRTLRSMYEAVISCFGREYEVYCYDERPEDLYEHPRGRACDFMISSGKAEGDRKAHGQAMAEWVMANAQELDVIYVIWFGRIWAEGKDEAGLPWTQWRPYNGGSVDGDPSSNHTNHVHVSVHWAEGDPSWARCTHDHCTN